MVRISEMLDVSIPLTRFLEFFWGKGGIAEVSNSAILIHTKARGNHKAFRRYLLKRFIQLYKLKPFYVTNKKDFLALSIKNYKNVFIASGDGFFNAVLNDKRFYDKTLGFFPLGAGNAMYPYVYGHLPFMSLRLKKTFYEKEIDVLTIKTKKLTIQTLFASIGFDAEFVKYDKTRTTDSKKDFMNCAKNVLVKKMPISDITYIADNQTIIQKNVFTAAFGKMPYYGYRIKSMPIKINSSDNNVYLCGYKGTPLHNLNKLLRIAHITPVPYIKKPIIKNVKGEKITINSQKKVALQYAGEFAGYVNTIDLKINRKQKILVSYY